MIAVEMLTALEAKIRQKTGDNNRVLSDQFDLVAGTSGGAIVGAAIAMGTPMTEVREFFVENANYLRKPAQWYTRWRSLYDKEAVSDQLRELYGADTTLGSEKLQSLLLIVLQNWSTDSPWLVSNNPYAEFNQPERDDCNLNLPLWQLARASAAAPLYFEPETITLGTKEQYEFVFVDGAITGLLNPAFKTFQYVTNGTYGIKWAASEEDLMLVSVGAGDTRNKRLDINEDDINILSSAIDIPDAMMNAACREQDQLCRTFGRCITGHEIDDEVGDMKVNKFPWDKKLFRYHRISPQLTEDGLRSIGCEHINHESITPVDCVEFVEQLAEVGRACFSQLDSVVRDCLD